MYPNGHVKPSPLLSSAKVMKMENILLVALAKKLEKMSEDVVIAPGDYQIDQTITLRITGTVKKGKPTEAAPTVKIPLLATMAILLERMGFQRERASEMISECMTEAMTTNVIASEIIVARIKDFEKAEELVKKTIAEMPKMPKAGPTNVKVEIEEIVEEDEPEQEPLMVA